MTATGHALVGTILAAKIGNPVVLFAVGFVSHFICDMVPHWDSGTHGEKKSPRRMFVEASIDVMVGFALSFLFFHYILQQDNYANLFIGIIAAQFPDWMSAPTSIFKIKHPFFLWLENIQIKVNQRLDKPWGIVTQVGVVLLTYFTLYKIF